MWIFSSNGKELINTDHVTRLFVNDLPDCVLMGADFGGIKPAKLGKYYDIKTAKAILGDIYQALEAGCEVFMMPDNGVDEPTPRKIMDSRVKRKGGS